MLPYSTSVSIGVRKEEYDFFLTQFVSMYLTNVFTRILKNLFFHTLKD